MTQAESSISLRPTSPAALAVLPLVPSLPALMAPHLAASLPLSHPCSRTLRGSLLPEIDIELPSPSPSTAWCPVTQPSSRRPGPLPPLHLC